MSSHNLLWEETLNVRADDLADHARSTTPTSPFQACPAANATLHANGEPVTRNMRRELRNAWAASEQHKHCTRRFKWSNSVHDDIDWRSFGSAMNNSEWCTHRFVQKFAREWLSHHEKLCSQHRSPTKVCPCYDKASENEAHFSQ